MKIEKVEICIACRMWVPIITDNYMAQMTCEVFGHVHHRHMRAIIPVNELDRKVYTRFTYGHETPQHRTIEEGSFKGTPKLW